MNYNKLYKLLKTKSDSNEIHALRSVVNLHNYYGRVQEDNKTIIVYCIECSTSREAQVAFPCPTIQAIEKEFL